MSEIDPAARRRRRWRRCGASTRRAPRAEVVGLTQMEGGWSRHTYAIDVEDPDREGLARYIGRVRPDDSVLDTDLGQEFEIYRILEDEPVPAPRVYGYEPSEDTPFGGPYFLMERISGRGLNVWRRPDRELLEADWEGGRGIAEDFVDGMAAIHRVDPAKLSGVVVERDFRATVARWRDIYEDVRLVPDPVVEEAYAWLLDNEPAPVTPRLVHGDYRIGNCLVDGGRMTGVLDWELAFIGDPRFDLGYMSLPYSAGRFVSLRHSVAADRRGRRAGLARPPLRGRDRRAGRPRGSRHVCRSGGPDAVLDHGYGTVPLRRRRKHRYPRCMVPFRVSGAACRPRRADGLVAT